MHCTVDFNYALPRVTREKRCTGGDDLSSRAVICFPTSFFSLCGLVLSSLRWKGGLSKEFQRNIDATDIASFARPRYAATCAMSKCHHRGEVPEIYVRIRARTSYSVSFNPGSWEQKTAFGRSLCRGAIGALAVASALQHYSNAHTSRCRPCGRKIARSAPAAVACVVFSGPPARC